MHQPLISILICTYNRADLIERTLESVLQQTYANVEIVVVDDGSTDGTEHVLERYRERLTYRRMPENGGIAAARNLACRLARGELIAFQDDDDLMPPERLNVLADAMSRFPSASFAVGDMAIVDERGEPTGSRWLPVRENDSKEPRLVEDGYRAVLWPTLPVAPHTTLFRRRDGERIGWFDPAFSRAAEDKDFFARLARLGPVVYVPEVVSLMRRGHASLTRNTARTEYFAMQLYRKHLSELEAHGARASPLYRRLQWRIGIALERIEQHRATGIELTGLPDDFVKAWLKHVRMIDRARYFWRTVLRRRSRDLWHRAFRGRRSIESTPARSGPTSNDRSPLRP